ncbi:MAG: Rne/Rng family ribonuclease [Deltaproteobacteria bacterium]|nr:Rne/Rng family ribonuclease [Deltaproteobacteria bacterium]MBW2070953.1 Rne/Rng family ribonuclease [Deltaproteobacteria bacterium]
MNRQMLINAEEPEEYRLAIVSGQKLEEFYIEFTSREQTVGNIYKGKVVHIHPSLEAAFVDFGADRNGFIQLNEIHPEYYQRQSGTDDRQVRIEEVLRTGQELLVQVVKEATASKGAYLTTYLSLPGRYLVLMPGSKHGGISRKIEDEDQRQRLRNIISQLTVPEGINVIVRTAGENRTKRELARDLNYLLRLWNSIKKSAQEVSAPALLYKERDLIIRAIRDYFTSDVKSILVDNKEVYKRIKDFMAIVSPRHRWLVKLYKEKRPIFAKYQLEEQIDTIFQNRVPLKSGGFLVIDTTEALVAIDVNSGKSSRERELEETAFKTNLEAAAEVPRQLRLRDLGGIVVIDFIDMKDRKHIRQVEKVLREEFKKDRARTEVGRIGKFGILAASRQRLRPSVQSTSHVPCERCGGTGMVRSTEAAAVAFLRKIWLKLSRNKEVNEVRCYFSEEVANYLLNKKRADLLKLESRYHTVIHIESRPDIPPGSGHLEFLQTDSAEANQEVL